MDIDMCDLTSMGTSESVEMEVEYVEWVFVDIQGYKVNSNRFMCKEFSLVNDTETFHAIVKSYFPYKKLLGHYKRQINWLTNHFHGLKYECGDMHIDELTKIVYPKLANKIVIVKGTEKVKWMQYLFRKHGDIICKNIEDFNYDMSQPDENYALCEYHNALYGWHKCQCAMANALKLQDMSNMNAPIRFF